MTQNDNPMWTEDLGVFRIMKWLVSTVAGDLELTSDRLSTLRVGDVYNWYHTNREEVLYELNSEELQERLKITAADVDVAERLLACPFKTIHVLMPAWHLLVFSAQPPVVAPVQEITVMVRIEYGDGEVRTVAMPAEIGTEFQRSHGYITTALKVTSGSLIDSLGLGGLSTLRSWDTDGPQPQMAPIATPKYHAEGYLGI